MGERKAGKVVSTVTCDLSGETTEVRVLQKPLRFRCEVGGEIFEDRDGEKVAAWAKDALQRNAVTEWVPVIEIFVAPRIHTRDGNPDPAYNAAKSCTVEYRRFHLGRTPRGAFREVPWHLFTLDDVKALAKAISDLTIKTESSWYSTAGANLGAFNGTLPYVDRGPRASYDTSDDYYERAQARALLPYSEETWNAVVAIGEALDRARLRLLDLVQAPGELQNLGAASVLALVGGKVEP